MRKTCVFAICSLLMLAIVGCSTIKGFGDDVSTIGKWLVKGSDAVTEDKAK